MLPVNETGVSKWCYNYKDVFTEIVMLYTYLH